MAMTLKSVTLTLCVLVTFLGIVNAATTSLILYTPPVITPGQNATYNCSSSGDGNDPRIYWSIKNGATEIANSDGNLMTSQNISGTGNPNDGAIRSSVTFFVSSTYTTNLYRIYCNAIDDGGSSIVLNIYDVINQTTTSSTAVLGGTCSSAVTCSTAFSFCDSSQSPNVCRCQPNYYDDNGENVADGSCDPKVSLGEECQAGNDNSCITTNAQCRFTTQYECVCRTGYVQSGANCVSQNAGIGDQCVNPTRSCPSNAFCNGATCQCNTGYVYSSSTGTCVISSAGIGDSCVNPTRACPSNSFCNGATCQCNSGYVYSSSSATCVTNSAGIGDQCVNPTRSCPSNSFCNGATCQCSSGYVYSIFTATCIPSSASIGQSCVNPTRSCPTNAFCNVATCQCFGGYVYSSLIGSCITTFAGIGDSCVNPTRSCPSNSFCNGATCQCNGGYVYSSSSATCVTNSAGIGDQCVNPTRSCPSNSFCNGATCQCNTGYVYSSSTATCVINSGGIGDSCVNPARSCPSNSFCNGATCQCNSGYVYSSSTASCVINSAGIGDQCVNPTRSCPSNSFCNGATCQCNSGYVYSSSTASCVTNSAGIGDQCVNPTRSCPSNSFCNGATCQCNSGYVYSSSTATCVTNSAGIGDQCVNPTRSCPSNSFCNGATCQCNSGYVYSSSTATCVTNSAGIGDSCINPSRSCPSNSFCDGVVCQCNTGYVYASSTGTCITSSASLGESCTSPTRSCVTNAACSSGICQCNTGYQSSGNTCILSTLGQFCTSAVGCQSSSGTTPICSNNVCACPSNNYALNSICYAKQTLGATCTQSVSNSCLDSSASCTGSGNPTCQCITGYIQSGSSCILDTSSQSCPSGSNQPSTVTGVSSPVTATTPSVYVNQTCYSVDLSGTMTMGCRDTKSGALKSARWLKLPSYTQIIPTTGSFINGDKANPSLTVSNAQASYAGQYICQLCYADSYTRCTNSSTVTLYVMGSAISSASVTVSPTGNILKGDTVTMTCNESPSGVADSYLWYKGTNQVGSGRTYRIASAIASSSGDYTCMATNTIGSRTSSVTTIDIQYTPEFSLPGGGSTQAISWNFDNGDLTLTCEMTANPGITRYYFYNQAGTLLNTPSSVNTYNVTSNQGYQTYSCKAQNAVGNSSLLNMEVTEDTGPNVGAATENTGISTGTIAAIVLGIIFFLLLLIIIIVCCCNYGWCRKKEKVEPQPPPPAAKPYIPRTIVSANSTVTRKDIGVMMNGHHDVSVSTDYEEPRYTTPRYHLKPAKDAGPIISMYDNGYEQPRPHQLPALDTQYLYTDDEPRKRHKKKRKRRHHEHRESSPRRHHYEPEPEPVTLQPSDEDLVVIPGGGKQNYFE